MISHGETIRQIRLLKRKTQREMAAEMFIGEATISNYERNISTPTEDFMQMIKEWALRAREANPQSPTDPQPPIYIYDEPKRQGQMFVYPPEMQLICAPQNIAENQLPPAGFAGPVSNEGTRVTTRSDMPIRYSETTPSVGDISLLLRTPIFSGSLKKMITWLEGA